MSDTAAAPAATTAPVSNAPSDSGSAPAIAGGSLLAGATQPAAPAQAVAATGTAPGSPEAFTWADGNGALSQGWQDRLAGEYRNAPALKAIGSIEDLAKSYVATKAMVGRKLEAPGEDATPEQIASWRKTVGAPEKPEGYLPEGAKSLRPDIIPENLWSAESESKFLALAHKHHLPPSAVKEIIGFHAATVADSLQQVGQQQETVLAEEVGKLKTAWGTEFDANLHTASRMAATVGLPPDHAIFTNADVVQAFAKMGKLISEDRLVSGTAQGVNGSIGARARDIVDPQSSSTLAREYRGEFGPERQAAAQSQYHQLLQASQQK